MSGVLVPDPRRALEFLKWLTPDAEFYLEHMNSHGDARPKSKAYSSNETSAATKFVAANNSAELQRNIYFLPNAEFLDGKRAKANLSAARFLHVDLDCKDYPGTLEDQKAHILALLLNKSDRPKGIPHPSAIWFTGGGYQAVWRMVEPAGVEEAEALNEAILVAVQGGEGTHDASRLLRLPWTINWLNDKKRAAGRTPLLAKPLDPANTNAPPVSFSLDDFTVRRPRKEAVLPIGTSTTAAAAPQIGPLPLPKDLTTLIPQDGKWSEVIASGQNPKTKDYGSRSELVFASVIWMLGKGIAPGHVLSIITSPEVGISAHVLENPNPLKYGRRQIERAQTVLELRKGGWPEVNDAGFPVANVPENIRYAFAQLGVRAQRNLFNQSDEVMGYQLDGRDLNDIGEILCSVFSRDLRFAANPAAIKRELMAVAHENRYHPVIDYLDGLTWDGVPRIDSWLATYCEAADTELNSEFGSKFLIAGVRRIKEPGVKFDTMLVLEGAQGTGKSRLAANLAVRDEWFCGSLDLKSDDKTKAELLARAWVVECQELDGMNKTTHQNLKRFLSTSTDIYRPSYGRAAAPFARHCVIIGTTNEERYFYDLTGNRRMWPVSVGKIDIDQLAADRDQLWAEAVAREQEGEALTLSTHLWVEAAQVQALRMVEDAYEDVLQGALADRTGRVSMDSVKLLLGLNTARMHKTDAQRVHAIMKSLGWVYSTYRLYDLSGSRVSDRKGFARGTPEQRKEELRAEWDGDHVVINTKRSKEVPF
jgi:hypothetical protein